LRVQEPEMLKSYYANQPYVKRRQSDAGI